MSDLSSRIVSDLRRHFIDFSEAVNDVPNRNLFLAEVFEGLLTSALGFQIGCFSESDVFELKRSVFAPFFFQISAAPQTETEYVVHSESSSELLREFRKFSVTLEKGLRREDYFTQPIRLQKPSRLLPYFNHIVLLQLQMRQDLGFRTFLCYFKFGDRGLWNDIMTEDVAPEDVLKASESQLPSGASMYYGFLRLCGYWSQLHDVLNEADSDLGGSADSARFGERIRDIFNWRIDLSSYELVNRFEYLKQAVTRRAISEGTEYNKHQIRNIFDELFDGVFGLERA